MGIQNFLFSCYQTFDFGIGPVTANTFTVITKRQIHAAGFKNRSYFLGMILLVIIESMEIST